MLNILWAAFFILAFLIAIIQSATDNPNIWVELANSVFATSETGFKIAINLTGVLCFWLGMMKIAEKQKQEKVG